MKFFALFFLGEEKHLKVGLDTDLISEMKKHFRR